MHTTRAELLVERADRLRDLQRNRHGWRRDVAPGAAMLAAGVVAPLALTELQDDPSGLSVTIWWSVVGLTTVGLLIVLVRRIRRSRSADAALLRWGGLDRTRSARALPPGDIPETLLTPFDARDRPDLDAVSSQAEASALGELYDTRALLWPGFRAIAPWIMGLLLLLGGAFAGEDATAGLPAAAVGLVVLGAASAAVWASWTEAFRRQQRVNGGFDRELYAARSAALGHRAPPDLEPVPLAARIVVGLIAVALVVILVVRVAASSTLAIVIVLAILASAVVLIAPPLLRRRALHVVPQTTGGDTVLDPPRRRVAVDLVEDALVISDPSRDVGPTTIELTTILAVVDTSLGYPFAPPAVGIVTADENIVLAGSGVRDLPAVMAARSPSANR